MSKYRTHEPQRPDGPLCNGKITHVTGARAWSARASSVATADEPTGPAPRVVVSASTSPAMASPWIDMAA